MCKLLGTLQQLARRDDFMHQTASQSIDCRYSGAAERQILGVARADQLHKTLSS